MTLHSHRNLFVERDVRARGRHGGTLGAAPVKRQPIHRPPVPWADPGMTRYQVPAPLTFWFNKHAIRARVPGANDGGFREAA